MSRIDPIYFDGKALKALLKKRKLTERELARMLNTTINSITYYATGRNEPSLKRIREMATILDCTIDELVKK